MATAIQSMNYQHPFSNQVGTQEELDNWLDLSPTLDGPSNQNQTRMNAITTSPNPSTITSPTTTILPLNADEDLQTPAKPSHEYERFKQQTGLPSGSVPGLQNGFRFSNSGIDAGIDDMMGWGDGMNFAGEGNMDMEMPMSTPAFFYPPGDASQQSDDFVDPSAISSQEEPQQAIRYWPGMHQQQALAAKAQAQAQQQRQQQMLQQQQKNRMDQQQQQQSRGQPSRRSASHQPVDARTEETIARVVNQIRQNSQLASQDMSPSGGLLPHIVKMKKDEEDMDEDERLLASEEGKKLSSKERRQLRNKVSARAFRSRRKEYIGQLEGEVNMKANECNDLRIQNRALMEENARSRAFIEKLLRHPAFTPFLEDLSRDESINNAMPQMRQAAPTVSSTPAMENKDAYAQQLPQGGRQQNLHVGMTLVPETPLDISMLSLNNNWGMPNGFNYQQPQIFAVTEVPEGPANPIDTAALSGKSFEAQPESYEEVKRTAPVIDRLVPSTQSFEVEKPAVTDEDMAFDNDPAFALYNSRSSPVANSRSAPSGSAFSKPSFHFTSSSFVEDDSIMEAALQESFARFDSINNRVNQSGRFGS